MEEGISYGVEKVNLGFMKYNKENKNDVSRKPKDD